MKSRFRSGVTLLIALVIMPAVWSQTPPADRVLVDVVMSEGTNMSVSMSPDGQHLILGIQGQLWTVPAGGGNASPLTPAEMDVYEPVWSPDGSLITFYAFAEDSFTVWMMNADGSGMVELTGGDSDARYPNFTPDGLGVIYASDEELGYALWQLDLASGERTRLTTDLETGYMQPDGPYFSGNGNAVYPAVSPDGNRLAFVIDGEVNRLVLRDMNGGALQTVYTAGILGAPLWAPDGNALYVVAVDGNSTHLAKVPVDGSAVMRLVDGGDVFPFRPTMAPDGSLLYTADGGVMTLDPQGRQAGGIRFSARVTLDRTPYQRRSYDFDNQSPQKALGIIDPVLSPDGSQVVFAAVGDLWWVDLTSTSPEPVKLTDDKFMALNPSWSPDGSMIAYISDREGKADIWIMDLVSRQSRRITDSPRPANMPVWSPDGSRLAYIVDDGNSIFISGNVTIVDLATGVTTAISEPIFGPSAPAWSPDGATVAIYHRLPMNSRFREGLNALYLLPASGQGDPVWVEPVPGKSLGRRQFNRPAWSVDGTMVYRIDGELWGASLTSDGKLGEPTRIAEFGENPGWSARGNKMIYLDGATIKLFDRDTGATHVLDIQPSWTRALNPETLTVRAGRLFDGVSDTYQNNVDIEIVNGVIADIRPAGSRPFTGRLIDASAKTVLPGLIESHTHQTNTEGIVLGQIYLSHGITSVRETGNDPYQAVERREAEASGRRAGPRVFTSGPLNEGARVSYGVSETVGTIEQAALSVRLSADLQLDMYKSYVRQDFTTQKAVIEMAHQTGIPLSSHELYPAVANGIDQLEHFGATSRRGFSLVTSRLNKSYQDVIDLIGSAGMVITPTLALNSRSGTRDISDREETLRRLIEAGAKIVAGTDSPFVPHASSLHEELEIYVNAGVSAARTLQTATSHAADALGAGDQIGTLAPGYLADILIVDGDPLANISDIRKIDTVIKSGFVEWTAGMSSGTARTGILEQVDHVH
ncbi:MAG: LpqB family beta-propeller domain-containing protein [Pseudohongiella sp.]|nr:LpqB family beta-propeller domain-containing protein [Pseudohongiella sp.]